MTSRRSSCFDEALFVVNKNSIRIDFAYLRRLVDRRFNKNEGLNGQDYSKIIERFVRVNDHVLERYQTFSCSISFRDLSVEDVKYVKFVCDLNEAMDEKYHKQPRRSIFSTAM